jgi:hypothetical protein
MTDRDNAQAAATGCLIRVFTLIGLFWLGAIGFDVLRNLDSGFDTDLTGALFPAIAFLFAASVMRRRAKEARARGDSFSAPSTPTGTHKATTRPPSAERGPTPTPTVAPRPEAPKKKAPGRPIPELPPIEPIPDAGNLSAIDNLEISDFEPGKPMSSEERIRQAREKYLKKRPTDGA